MREHVEALTNTVTAKYELAVEILRSYGTFRFTATGWSMLPAIWSGDMLVVDRVRAGQIQIGDIAVVGRDGRLCAHRVVRLPEDTKNENWITQGDGLPTPDRPFVENEFLGRVTEVFRAGRCIALSPNLKGIDFLLAQIVRRSVFATRVFVYLSNKFKSRRVEPLCQR
jgi:signal peptidase I